MEYLQYLAPFNTIREFDIQVLNLVINGIPSIHTGRYTMSKFVFSFKPCYKWNTFNTVVVEFVNGMREYCFKPCYKWNTFNTIPAIRKSRCNSWVLNLVINGIPSILSKFLS